MIKKVAIVGAGPSGVLLAHYLLRRGDCYQIDIYDHEPDPRTVSFENSRTYPLALYEKGLSALRKIEGIEAAVKAKGIEIEGTIVHTKNGKTRLLPRKKTLVALDRNDFVVALLEKLTEKYDNSKVNLHFNCKCTSVDLGAKTVLLQTVTKGTLEAVGKEFTVAYDLLIGADGAHSAVRTHLLNTELFEFEQRYVPADYKIVFLPRCNEKAGIDLKPGNIHGWRLDDNTAAILAVPTPDDTVSAMITFLRDKNQVVDFSTKEQVLEFFRQNFPDIGQIIPELEAEAFLSRPVSTILTIRCSRYHYSDSVLLIGDAAHAVSPSLGQSRNSALEDVVVFDSLLDEYFDNLAEVLPEFTVRRKRDTYALQELCESRFPLSETLVIELSLR